MTINSRWSSTLENWFCQRGVMLLFRNRTISGSIYWVLRFKTTYPASENCLQMCLQLNRGRHQFESNVPGFERAWFCGRFKFSLINLLFLNSIFQRCSEAEENLRRGSSERWEIYVDLKENEVAFFRNLCGWKWPNKSVEISW